MDSLRFSIGAVPLAVYFLLIGLLNLRQQPFVTTGARDSAALGIGILGLMVIGPIDLLLPEAAAIRFGPYVWILLIAFYGLCLSMIVLLMRPRLVVYNSTIDQLRPMITEIAHAMDQKSRWTSDSMVIPSRKVHFHLESVEWLHNVQIISTGNRQSYDGWREIEKRLSEAARTSRIRPNIVGLLFSAFAGVLLASSVVFLMLDRAGATQALNELLRN